MLENEMHLEVHQMSLIFGDNAHFYKLPFHNKIINLVLDGLIGLITRPFVTLSYLFAGIVLTGIGLYYATRVVSSCKYKNYSY